MELQTDLVAQVRDLCSGENSETRLYERAVDCIYDAGPHYNWVGIYKVVGNELILSGWRGPQATTHTRIPLDRGVCGFAATSGETVVVDDVNADPRYLECFAETKSEMVVPIRSRDTVVAEIDIDSDSAAAFRAEDRKVIEEVAELLGARVAEL